MSNQFKLGRGQKSPYPIPFLDGLLIVASRYHATLLLFLVCFAVAVVGVFVIRDLQGANAEAQNVFTGSIHGLQRIGELQFDAQETRRATLYALTTSDSNLQIEYADQSRNADQRVKDGIAEYARQARRPAEIALALRLAHDWAKYLKIRDEVLASILEGSTKEAVDLDLSGGVPAFEILRKDLTDVKRLYDEDASQRLQNLVDSSRRSIVKLIGILGFTFLLASAAVWAIQRSHMLSTLQLAKLQMEFVASVSHELRTPLAVMSSAADNIADGLIDGKVSMQKYGVVLQNQSRRMSAMVDEILLFASTENGKNRYVLEPLNISRVVDSALSAAAEMVQAAGFIIDQDIEPFLPPVIGDRSGVSQCLQNLIGNAVKYGGDHRRIALRAWAASVDYGSGMEVRLSVTDRGIGIEPSEFGRIFDPFYRSPRVSAMQIHGTGLGLSLAKRISEAMGGRISVVSEPPLGTTFTLHLQIAKGQDVREAAIASRDRLEPKIYE